MSSEFLMPKLGLTMEEGTIVEWLVDDGAAITAGRPVLVIETDKTETEVEAVATGVLQRTGSVGDTFQCGEVIGYVLADGEAPQSAPTASPAPAPPPPTAAGPAPARPTAPSATASVTPTGRIIASPNARRVAAERRIDIATVRGTGPSGRITSEDVVDVAEGRVATVAQVSGQPAPTAGPPVASPATIGQAPPATVAARQVADLLGIDLSTVPVDPADGRVTRDAVARHVRALLAVPTKEPTPAIELAPAMQAPSEMIRLSGIRGTIATRMHASLQQMAQLTLTMDADMSAVLSDRSRRKGTEPHPPGVTDYVLAASARALRDNPRVNAQITDGGIALLPGIHVGLAVALDEGLIVPVVRDADRRSLEEIAPETTRLAEAARAGTLGPDDVQGGTFSVTALGMFGVDAFTPVINPPNVAILGVGRIRDDGNMTLSLTWDHRAFDGAPAAQFTKSVCDHLADPSSLGSPT